MVSTCIKYSMVWYYDTLLLIQPRCSARDEEAGEIPVAYVVRKQGIELSEADVMDFVAKQV